MRLGADPEVFLVNKQLNLVSAVGIVPGTKEKPQQISGLPPGFTVQQDNVAIEYGIPPASDAEEFSEFIHTVVTHGHNYHKQLLTTRLSFADFPKEQLKTAEARHFGCEPDFNAWLDGKENPRPVPPKPTVRSAGGHIHVETKLDKLVVVRALDLFLGVPSICLDLAGAERRKIYGGPGAYRPKPYGVEYRVLSNFWIFGHHLRVWVWENTEKALKQVMKGKTFTDVRIREAIENNNRDLAEQLIIEYKVGMS